jgi:hypothetical protein
VNATNIIAVAGGASHSLALSGSGSLVAWGSNWKNQCDVPVGLTTGTGMAAGEAHTLLLLDGTVPMPRALLPALTGSGFSVLVQTLNRHFYGLEYKDSLAQTNWSELVIVPGNGALRILTDPGPSPAQRLYRTRH